MRRISKLAGLVVAGFFTFGTTVGVSFAADNTTSPPKPKVKFDHKSLGVDTKDCKKCHKVNPLPKSTAAPTKPTAPTAPTTPPPPPKPPTKK